MKTIVCDNHYSEQILAIFNDVIATSTALYDYKPRTLANMVTWFENKSMHNYPVIGVVDEQDRLMGFGSYGTFRAWPAYRYSVEHSLYVHKDHRGKGLGKIILAEIIRKAGEQDYHCLVAGIDSSNDVSIKLHKAAGFQYSGTIKHAGFKFSRWLDLDFYQLLLNTPAHPVEG